MAFSLMNGLSSLGTGVAAFAATAGIEQQKADLARQSVVLADQLATTRETTLQKSGGDIAAAAAEKAQAATAANTQALIAGRTADVGIEQAGATARTQADIQARKDAAAIVAASPAEQETIFAKRAETALNNVKAKNAQDLTDARTNLQTETAKPDADPAKIQAARDQITSLEYSGTTAAANNTAATALYRVDQDAVTQLNTRLQAATAAVNTPGMEDVDKVKAKAELDSLNVQLKAAMVARDDSSRRAHAAAAQASTGTAAPGAAPTLPDGVPPGARYSPSMKIWQAPDGRLFDGQGKPTTAPGTQAAPQANSGFLNNGAGSPAVVN
jgi:hypothetical protein